MTNREKAAYAARNCQSNDIEDPDDIVGILSDMISEIAGILVPDEMLRAFVLADAFAKCYANDLSTDDISEDVEDAKDIVGELVARYIMDGYPVMDSEFDACMDDEYEIYSDCEESGCDSSLCGGDCSTCPFNDLIPRFVYEDGLVRKVLVRRDSDD